jgi:hypothetical protein
VVLAIPLTAATRATIREFNLDKDGDTRSRASEGA